MSTSSLPTTSIEPLPDDGYEPYRAISKGAVGSLLLGIFSSLGMYFPSLLILAVFGFFMGISAFRNIRRYPVELTGKAPALIGAALSVALLAIGATKHFYDYATEVPEGYQRISFANLQPVPEHPELPVSPDSLRLNEKKVFVKGYVYPDGQKTNIRRFILVPDMGTCCFGGQPKLTDMIEVTLADSKRIEYSFRKRKLGGLLRVDTALKPVTGVDGVFFQLEADHLQ